MTDRNLYKNKKYTNVKPFYITQWYYTGQVRTESNYQDMRHYDLTGKITLESINIHNYEIVYRRSGIIKRLYNYGKKVIVCYDKYGDIIKTKVIHDS